MNDTIRLGISTCLLGKKVRWDGGHKLDTFLTQTFGRFVEYVPVCPEVEAGFGIPRESMRLVGQPQSPRLIASQSKTDLTNRMLAWTKAKVKQLETENLCGFIFKSNSPSSGMVRVNVYSDKGSAVKKGIGVFAREFMNHFPLIPVEDDRRLHNPAIRDNFIERIFTLKRWRETRSKHQTMNELIDFHSCNKLRVLSHSPRHASRMGKLVGTGKTFDVHNAFSQYETFLMEALLLRATIKKHLNVLQHIMGYFKNRLTSDEKKEVLEIVDAYRNGEVPLLVPITLMNHYVRKYDSLYLKTQTYLHPHPIELKIRRCFQ